MAQPSGCVTTAKPTHAFSGPDPESSQQRPRVRLLPPTVADGPHQMAADETLMETAAQGTATLRFYEWTTATVSLGYFQPAGARLLDPRLPSLPWLRRPSGGEALVHDREVTYCLALPAGLPWQRRCESWARRFHELLREVFTHLGVAVTLCPPDGERRLGEFLCFLHHSPDDVLISGSKIVGSAQRRPAGALMQHGSILLAQSPHTPDLPGIAELTGRQVNANELAAAVCERMTEGFQWDIVPGDWSAVERERIEELATSRYASAEWNARR
jgi:lipoate-protein ligase A